MAGMDPRAGMVPVERTELITQDVDLLADLVSQAYSEYAATFRCADPAQVEGVVRTATAGTLSARQLRYTGFEYGADGEEPFASLLVLAVTRGRGLIATAREEQRFATGDVYMCPTDLPCSTTMENGGYVTLQLPGAVAGSLAEEQTGTLAADLRFESMAPVSASRARMFTQTAEFICGQLVTSGATGVHRLVAQELTRLAAATILETFPNTTMTTGYLPGPGWAPPAAVRRAAAFIDAHAGQPLTLAQMAAVAGVSGRALQYAFGRHFGTTPIGYLRRVRLERARQDLINADPASGLTVDAVARRWGWASAGQFTVAYQRRFGVLPSHTLRM